mmetsp:Transcript_27943/g.74261  ORF Transcript_27943/g.74261 Transcript_27943/m.74261 type:complete len:211 (+) Transcript_27943:1562-2194(+)
MASSCAASRSCPLGAGAVSAIAEAFLMNRKARSRTLCAGAVDHSWHERRKNRDRWCLNGHSHESASGPLQLRSTNSSMCWATRWDNRKYVSSQKICANTFTRVHREYRVTSVAPEASGSSSADSLPFRCLFLRLPRPPGSVCSSPACARSSPGMLATDHSRTCEKTASSSILSRPRPRLLRGAFSTPSASSPLPSAAWAPPDSMERTAVW